MFHSTHRTLFSSRSLRTFAFFFCFIHELWRTPDERISVFTSIDLDGEDSDEFFPYRWELRTELFISMFILHMFTSSRKAANLHTPSSVLNLFSRSRKNLELKSGKKKWHTNFFLLETIEHSIRFAHFDRVIATFALSYLNECQKWFAYFSSRYSAHGTRKHNNFSSFLFGRLKTFYYTYQNASRLI